MSSPSFLPCFPPLRPYISRVTFKRVIILILDACGVGELPDAAAYGDRGAATIPNVARAIGGLSMPTCGRLGLGNIVPIEGVPPNLSPAACFGKMAETSPGKDSTTGHWEIAGIHLTEPFPVFPDGFPDDIVKKFEHAAGVKTIGNIAASGTEIIKQLGEEHLRSGALILYTSADSVFQLAAHEDLYPPEKLYEICQIARGLLIDKYNVGRVIARPFIGTPGHFERTPRRRDFSRTPPTDTVLDLLVKSGRSVFAIGKIQDLFAGRGISEYVKTSYNTDVMDHLIATVRDDTNHSLIFANCVDFDMLWGHRNDETAFAHGLEEFDSRLAELLPILRIDDLLVITADHGCDPTIKTSTDHTREYVPLLVYGPQARHGVNLGTRTSFADIAATIADNFDLCHSFEADSFISSISTDSE